jgi:hypothetical protein
MTEWDLRSARRYQMAAPTDFWWLEPSGATREGHGITRDISNTGVMIMSEECPSVGVRVQMSVFVPRRQESRNHLELHGEGRVVRVEETSATPQGESTKGFAASVQFYPESFSDVDQLNGDGS